MNPIQRPPTAARAAALAAPKRRRPRLTKQTAILAVIAQLLAVVGIVALTGSPASASPAPVMTGYVPLPADDFVGALEEISADSGTTLDFTVGVTNAGAGAVMYYDQWEDGFEADLSAVSQSTTLIFGDGNTTNGNAATYCSRCTGDTLPQGAALIMRNNVSTPRSAATRRFDGGDKVASTRGFAITAGGFTTDLGSLLASVVASYDTSKYDTAYTAPVGTDTPVPSGTSNAFSYAAFIVQAAEDDTVVQVDKDGDGTSDVTTTIDEGTSTRVTGIKEGGTVRSSAPVQVQLMTGDTGASWEGRSYTLFPDTTLSDDYLSPAGSSRNSFRTINYLYNPHDTDLTVTPTCTGCSGTITVGANASAAFATPTGQGVRFTSDDGRTFVALAGVGAQSGALPGSSGDESASWDWGFSMIPASQLTTQVVLGWAPGNSNNPPSSPSGNRDDGPVWVTTLSSTTVKVDFDGDPSTGSISSSDCFGARHDSEISVTALASTRIYDSTDGDMTGARIYTCDGTKVAGAWGEDPSNAPVSSPGFDAGYTIIPTTTMLVNKTGALGNDLDGDGAFGVGDTISYEIAIADAGSLAFTGVQLDDELPDGLRYVPDSTVIDDGATTSPIPDDAVPPAGTPFPLDEAGTELPNINAGDTVYVRFDAEIISPSTLSTASIGNTACVSAAEASACDSTTTDLVTADLSLTKDITTAPAQVGDEVTYTLTVTNDGPDAASGVEVTDSFSEGLDLQSATPSQGTFDGPSGVWSVGDLAPGTSATLDLVATVLVGTVYNQAEITRSGAWDPDSQPAEDVLGMLGPNQDDEAQADIEGLPDPTDAVDDTYNTPYATPLVIPAPGLLGNDTGSNISTSTHTFPAQGSLSINPDGTFTYTPVAGFYGTDSFTYTITGDAGSDTATVTITVPAPDAPVAVDDFHTTPYATPLVIGAPGALGNDSGTGIKVSDSMQPAHGTVTINADGSFTYTPDAGFAGEDSFPYEITDEANQTSDAVVHITVDPPAAPTADDDAYTTGYETSLVVPTTGVLGNDTGTDVEVTYFMQPNHGTVTMGSDGSLTYVPEPGFTGTDTFFYEITDVVGQTAQATVTITVDPPAAPVATDDSASTPFETPLTVVVPGVLSNDTGTGITVTDHTDPAHGTLTVNPDGAFTYTPDTGFTGDDTFTYEITDEVGQTATASVTITVDPPNAPVARDDDYTTPFETPLTIEAPGVLDDDSGTRIAVSGHTAAAHGTLVVNLDGSLTYTPDDGFTGEDTATYEIVDAIGQTSEATITITVPAPDAPVAVDDDHTTPYDTTLTVPAPGILGNDSGTEITVTDRTSASHGKLNVAADGSLVYSPAMGFAGEDTFDYTITDPAGQTSTATVTITVEPPAAPVATDDAYATPYETPITVAAPGLLGNDTGTDITVTDHSAPAHGTVVANPDGSLSYTPDDGFFGDDTFTYEITDAVGQTSTATVTITVAKPGAPAAADDGYTTPFETTLTVAAPGVLDNDSGTKITVTDVGTPSHGSASIAADGTLTYEPDTGFAGTDTFTYEITDAAGQTATATVTVTVDPPAAPDAIDDTHTTPYETPITVAVPGILGNDTGTRITITLHDPVHHGTLVLNDDGSFTYTPDDGYYGTENVDYTITDAAGQTDEATLTLIVSPPAAPDAVDDDYTTPYATPLTLPAPGIIGNDTGTGIRVTDNGGPSHGSVTVDADGSITYTPVSGFAGTDSFTYELSDEVGQTDTATVTITIEPPAVPEANDDDYATPYETPLVVTAPGIMGNDAGEKIKVISYSSPLHGSVFVSDTGAFTYTPDDGYFGTDAFDYTIEDAVGQTVPATVRITIAKPGAPAAADDSYTTPYQTLLTVDVPGVLGNDSGTGITVTDVGTPGHGGVKLGADGNLQYLPDDGFTGTDTFTYTITDEAGQTATATVTVTVDPPAAPTADDDAYATDYETPVTITAPGILGNDTGTVIEVGSYTQPANGTVTVDPDGRFTYTPDEGFTGDDTFTYAIVDEVGQTAEATVTITVGLPDGPVAVDDEHTTPYETSLVVDAPGVLTNDSGEWINVVDHTSPGHGGLVILLDGSFVYTPDAGFTGTDTFTYTISDAFDQTTTATVTITVEPPLAPEAIDDVASTPYETPITVDAPGALGNDSGTGITLTSYTQPGHGSVVANADGSFTYTPDAGFAGEDTFDYVIADEVGQSASAVVTITVAPPGGPVAADDDFTTPYETELVVDPDGILGNDAGTKVTVTDHTDPAHGTVTVNADGSISYTPEPGFTGLDTFTYEITDGFDRTASATVRITVDPPAAPEAVDDGYTTPYETPITVDAPGILGNDSGTGISVAMNGSPAHGTVTVDADGTITYTPEAGFAGEDTFTYAIVDEVGQTATATVTITVDPPAAPVAVDDAYTTPFETPITVDAPGIVGNDSGTGTTVTDHSAPTHGTVTVGPDGSLTYTPDAGFAGDDTFTYEITDEVGQTATATVTITVDRPAGPKAVDDVDSTPYETPLVVAAPGLLPNDSGTDIEVLDWTSPAHGTVAAAADGSYTYTPDDGFFGEDTFTYTIVDGWDRTSTATVTITVGRPGAPVAVDDAYETPFETALVVEVPGIAGNDSGTGIGVTANTDPGHGTVSVGSDGSMTYVPDEGFAGTDTFDYTITDTAGQTATATVTITVVPPAAPAAVDDAYETPFETAYVLGAPGILGNDSGTKITVSLHGDPSHGTVTVGDDGSMTYTPDDGFTGEDSFPYTIVDQLGRTAEATVTITVAKPGAPVAADDAYTTPYETVLEVAGPGIVGNDTGTGLTVTAHTDPSHGTVEVAADGTITYTPDAGFTGTDTFTYTVTDLAGQTSDAVVTIVVSPPNGPVATPDEGRTPYDTPLVVAAPGALANDSGTNITVKDHTDPAHGTLTLGVDGTWTYTPEPGFVGVDSVTYTIVDEVGQEAQSTITITVDPPEAPVAVDDSYVGTYDTPLVIDPTELLDNDSGTDITVTVTTQPGHGTVVIGDDGTLTYTPEPGFSGEDAFTYTITDGAGQEATATVTITIDPPEETTTTTTEPETTTSTTEVTSTTEATTTTGAEVVATSTPAPADPPPSEGTIARTGSDVTRWVVPSIAMVVAGGALLVLARRRRLA